IELTWAVNHLAAFLLTTSLLDRLEESAPARIVTTSSDAHVGARIPFDDLAGDRGYGRGFRRYGETKLANILFTVELARRLEGTGVTANCFHPGLVATGFNRNNGILMSMGMTFARPFSRSAHKGAETLVWLLDSPEVGAENGGYFMDKRRRTPSGRARGAEAAGRLRGVPRKGPRGRGTRQLRRRAGSEGTRIRRALRRPPERSRAQGPARPSGRLPGTPSGRMAPTALRASREGSPARDPERRSPPPCRS